jgi:predicted amidohydrolase YtcJ
VPPPTPEQNRKAAEAALAMMASQGVTGFLDAAAGLESIEAFSAVHAAGGLTARGHFAVAMDPKEGADPAAAVARVVDVSRRHDGGAPQPAPGIRVRNAKLFLDGVIAAPALTGTMLEPYRVNAGTADAPRWVPGSSRGPEPYFPAAPLAAILTGLGSNGINPHIHADGDGAVRAALDGYEAMRKALPGKDIRAAIAHNEIVSEQDRPRYRALDVVPVLSMQWGKPAGDTLGLVDIFGPERMAMIEPAGLLAAHGARIAFGSDWPVDALDEWFALKVGVTRSNRPDADPAYRGRLGKDPGLSAEAVLRAATINAAYSLHQDAVTGSLEAGKFADFIVLDRNPLTIPPEDIANVKVLRTVVGGKTVYTAP